MLIQIPAMISSMNIPVGNMLLKRQIAILLEVVTHQQGLMTLTHYSRLDRSLLDYTQLLTTSIKIRVLQQLSQWVMLHPERIREKMDEQKPSDQTDWVRGNST